jgi:hydrogenase-4 membrane subunit HyfE
VTAAASLTGAFALALSVALLCVQRISTAVIVCAIQALLAATALATLHWQPAAIAALAFALNSVTLPLAMLRLLRRPATPQVITARHSAAGFWLATVLLLAISVAAFTQVRPVSPNDALVLGSSIVLLGLLLIAQRSHPLLPALGLLSSQNGVLLVASATPDLPLSARLIVILPLLPGLVLANTWLRT